MKIDKIICDICGSEVNIETDEDMAMFKRFRTRTKLNLQTLQGPRPAASEKELVESSFDLCKKCGSDTEDFLVKKKEKLSEGIDRVKKVEK